MSPNPLRNIPSVNELLESPPLRKLVDRLSHNVVVDGVRRVLDDLRQQAQNAASELAPPAISELAERVARRILEHEPPRLGPVINATGVLLHPQFGPPPLADEAVEEIAAAARAYVNLELDLNSGATSARTASIDRLLCELTGAEAATVVASAAGATMLALGALAAGREVVVSRGQFVEIGAGCRLEQLAAAGGAVLREVGATNRTVAEDYEAAVGDRTGALLLVQPSHYVVAGLCENAGLEQLVEVGRRHNTPVIHALGVGGLVDLPPLAPLRQPTAAGSIKAGADLVLLAGEGLLGGPPCGIILGRKSRIEQVARHTTGRAFAIDKLTLAALGATLRLYRDREKVRHRVPLVSLLGTSVENLQKRAERLAPQMAAAGAIRKAEPVAGAAYLGPGSIPTQRLESWCVALEPADRTVDQLVAALRGGSPAVVGRVEEGRLLVDLRSVLPRDDQHLVAAVAALTPDVPSTE